MSELQIIYVWLFTGALFIALEAFGMSGLGFFFGGVAALGVALIVKLGYAPMDDYFLQGVWFFGLTTFWGVLLWKPMKKLRSGTGKNSYSHIVGETAVVGEGGLKKGEQGKAAWSGTIMVAELSPTAGVDQVPAGTRVKIVEVKGARLIVDVNA